LSHNATGVATAAAGPGRSSRHARAPPYANQIKHLPPTSGGATCAVDPDMRAGFVAGALLTLGCAGSSTPDDAASAQAIDDVEERVALVLDDPEGGRLARVGHTEYALVGGPVAALEVGREYALDMKQTTAAPRAGRTTRLVVGARKVLRLAGTLSDDAGDAKAMRLRARGREVRLTGATVRAYRDVRDALPEHDYSATLFRVRAVAERGDATRFAWLDYAPVPSFECADRAEPDVHLDLVRVRADASVLDGFVETRGAGAPLFGARATCSREGDGYACVLADFGGEWGKGRLAPEGGAFSLTVERGAGAAVSFGCAAVDAAAVADASE
jgi:hypothetical protein